MIDQLEKEIHEGMLDLYQHCGMSRERESLLYLYFASLHNEKITLQELVEEKQTRIDKAIEYIETHQLNFKKGITTFGSERLSMEERKLLDILRGDKE